MHDNWKTGDIPNTAFNFSEVLGKIIKQKEALIYGFFLFDFEIVKAVSGRGLI